VRIFFSASIVLAILTIIFSEMAYAGLEQESSERFTSIDGIILEVDTASETFSLRTETGEDFLVRVHRNTNLRTKRGRGVGFGDLRKGMGARVQGIREEPQEQRQALSATTVFAQAGTPRPSLQDRPEAQVFSGRIVSVRRDSVSVQGKYGSEPRSSITTESFTLLPTTRVLVNYRGKGGDLLTFIGRLSQLRVDRGRALQITVRD
jgi:hypothetical protein